MNITKKEIIQKLYSIEEANNIKLGREVQRVIRNEIIPIDIIKLINKYDKEFLQIYDTYNTIYLSKDRNPLYRNLRNKNLPLTEVAIAISSLLTKILISYSKIAEESDRKLFAAAMNIKQLTDAIYNYAVYEDASGLVTTSKEVRELLEILYDN